MKCKDFPIGQRFNFVKHLQHCKRNTYQRVDDTEIDVYYGDVYGGSMSISVFTDWEVVPMLFKDLKEGDLLTFNIHRYNPRNIYKKHGNDCFCVGSTNKGLSGDLLGPYCGDYSSYEVTPWVPQVNPNPKLNLIEALQALKEGKKVTCDDKDFTAKYIYLKNGQFYDELDESTYLDEVRSLEEGMWEVYIEPKVVEVKLNSEYTAVVSPDGVKVGCQMFELDKVQELANAIKKVKE
jgi:hypothetical protein